MKLLIGTRGCSCSGSSNIVINASVTRVCEKIRALVRAHPRLPKVHKNIIFLQVHEHVLRF